MTVVHLGETVSGDVRLGGGHDGVGEGDRE